MSQDDVKAVAADAAKLADDENDAKLGGLIREAAGKECLRLQNNSAQNGLIRIVKYDSKVSFTHLFLNRKMRDVNLVNY